MADSLSNTNIANENDENALYEQYINDISTGNVDFELFVDQQTFDSSQFDESLTDNLQNILQKVDRDTISQSHVKSTDVDKDGNVDTISSLSTDTEINPQSVFLSLKVIGVDSIHLEIIRQSDIERKNIENSLPLVKVSQPHQHQQQAPSVICIKKEWIEEVD
ncbi:MAG: hypothetical protein ACTHKK_03535 [Candidatus Nitrosocosmicus sp.]